MPRIRHAVPLLLIAAIVLFFLFRLDRHLSFDRLIESRAALREYVARHGALALAGYMALYVSIASLSVPASVVFTLTGGFLFGTFVGGLAAATSATLGAVVVFLAARTVLHDFLVRKAGGVVGRIRQGFRQSAWSYMLFLRLSPIFPFWLVNIGAALAGVPLKTFAWTTAFGILPITFVVAFAGENLDRVAAASAAALEACRTAGQAECHAGLPLREILSPSVVAILIASSLLALTPALARTLRARGPDSP
jgi:uncharacterized membrane protein YdjX (TVP38/TMEM64 family)